MFYIMAVIGLTSWTGLAASRAWRISSAQLPALPAGRAGPRRERLPRHRAASAANALGPILVSATFGVASAILDRVEPELPRLRMQAPTPSWGDILSDARRYIDFAWWLAFFPGSPPF